MKNKIRDPTLEVQLLLVIMNIIGNKYLCLK